MDDETFLIFSVEQKDTGFAFDPVSDGEPVEVPDLAPAREVQIMASPSPVQMLDVGEVCDLFAIAGSTLYDKLSRDPPFPRPRQLGRSVRWRADELAQYQDNLPTAEYTPPPAQ